MGGCRCSYRNCANTTKTRENLHFFHYPVKHKERCRQWIENADKPQFYNLDEDQLRNKVICETHFKDYYFPNLQKKRLLQGAIPTLDGDCLVQQPPSSSKINDVQVLPVNDDGTIFLLATSQLEDHSEKMESYIYTNNGLVLPINEFGEVNGTAQHMFAHNEGEETEETEPGTLLKMEHQDSLNSSCENLSQLDNVNLVFPTENTSVCEDFKIITDEGKSIKKTVKFRPQEELLEKTETASDTDKYKDMEDKYVKKIKQHSRDIAKIKRILKAKSHTHKPSNITILNTLKRQLPSGLLSIVNLQLRDTCELSPEDIDFFSLVYSTSPELYQILSQQYKWRLPTPDVLKSGRTNGHVNSSDI